MRRRMGVTCLVMIGLLVLAGGARAHDTVSNGQPSVAGARQRR